MVLKAVLFDFNGVIIDDEGIHEALIEQILLDENLRPKPGEFNQFCLGRSDRACILSLLEDRGRYISEEYLDKILQRKTEAYQQQLETLERLPIYPDAESLLFKFQGAGLKMAVVSGALRSEIELILDRSRLARYFSLVVGGDDITTSKPEPDGYLLALERLKQAHPELNLQPSECLVVEDTFAGIEAAKRAEMKVVGVAHTYPFHMLQRLCNWTVDYLTELEVDRVQRVFEGRERDVELEEISS